MGIQEDIFGAFLAKLKEDAEFPSDLIEELKRLWETNEITFEDIIKALKENVGDAGEDKDD